MKRQSSDNFSYNGNGMQPGTFYVADNYTDQFRYIDKDGTEQWLVPCSAYYAGEDIKRGQAVSITSRGQYLDNTLNEVSLATDDYPYVHLTNPDVDTTCLGLAMHPAKKGQIVHVQNHGIFTFSKVNNTIDEDNEYWPNWDFSAVAGQRLFCSKVDETDDVNAKPGMFTYDYIHSIYKTNNTIQIGYLVDAPLKNPGKDNSSQTKEIKIELEVTGDTRGPIDNTQYIVTLGEGFTLNEDDQIRVFALGNRDASLPEVWFSSVELSNQKGFVGVRSITDDKAYIIPINLSETTIDDLIANDIANSTDAGWLRLTKQYCSGAEIVSAVADTSSFKEAFAKAVNSLIKLAGENGTVESKTITDSSAYFTNTPTGAEVFGFRGSVFSNIGCHNLDFFVSEDLAQVMQINVVDNGSLDTRGKAILADIRTDERARALGVYCGKGFGEHKAGEQITLMRIGTYDFTAPQTGALDNKTGEPIFEDGRTYYLTLNGRVGYDRSEFYYDRNVIVGQSDLSTKAGDTSHTDYGRLIVNISEPMQSYSGSLPMGYIKPLSEYTTEETDSDGNTSTIYHEAESDYGFLKMDGTSTYSKETYSDLYEMLKGMYSSDDLQDSGTTFVIPSVIQTSKNGHNVHCQIKYIPAGMYKDIPRVPFMRFIGTFEGNGQIDDIDISKLVSYGALEESITAPSLDNIDVKLYYQEASNDKIWREIHPGFGVYNNTQLYGYDWSVVDQTQLGTDQVKSGSYFLRMNIEDGMGPCKIHASEPPIQLTGKKWCIVVTRRELYDRQFDLSVYANSDFISKTAYIDSDTMSPTVNAMKQYISDGVTSDKLTVGDNILIADNEEDGDVVKISSGTNFLVGSILRIAKNASTVEVYNASKEKWESVLITSDLEDHKDETLDDGVHGIKNTGYNGNIDAHTLWGLKPKTSIEHSDSSSAYLPIVDTDGLLSIGTAVVFAGTDAEVTQTVTEEQRLLSLPSATTEYNDKVMAGTSYMYWNYNLSNGKATLKKNATNGDTLGDIEVGTATVTNLVTNQLNGEDLTTAIKAATESSSIEFKEVLREYLQDTLPKTYSEIKSKTTDVNRESIGSYVVGSDLDSLKSNVSGRTYAELNSSWTKTGPIVDKIGSALQALYEVPLAQFRYKDAIKAERNRKDNITPKEYLGVLVERLDEYSAAFKKEIDSSTATFKSHAMKVNKSSSEQSKLAEEGWRYSKEEMAAIAYDLDQLSESIHGVNRNQNIISSIGLLMQAAKEVQKRLLDIEVSIYGMDAPTLPGASDRDLKNDTYIAPKLQDYIDQTPLLLGLNRVIKALSLEVFNTANLDKIVSEEITTDPSSESSNDKKITVLSRLDIVDQNLQSLYKQLNKMLTLLIANKNEIYSHIAKNASVNDEGHGEGKEEDGTWNTLPNASEYSKDVYSTYDKINERNGTHGPLDSEITTITDLKLVDTYDGATQTRELSIAETPRTVAWLDDKVERINKKLTKVVSDLYGVDEVLTAEPNALGVIRRNISELIEDIYPNREFKAENKLDNGLLSPFKQSATQNDTSAVAGPGYSDENPEEADKDWNSVIDAYDANLYNFSISNDLIDEKWVVSKGSTGKYTNIEKSNDGSTTYKPHGYTFSVKGCSVDDYFAALSKVDLVLDKLGVSTTYFNDLYLDADILKAGYGVNTDVNVWFNKLSTSSPKAIIYTSVAAPYESDLSYYDLSTETSSDGTKSYKFINRGYDENKDEWYWQSTTAGAYVSRKYKTHEARLSAIESALDGLATMIAAYKPLYYIGDEYHINESSFTRFEHMSSSALEQTAHDIRQIRNLAKNTELIKYYLNSNALEDQYIVYEPNNIGLVINYESWKAAYLGKIGTSYAIGNYIAKNELRCSLQNGVYSYVSSGSASDSSSNSISAILSSINSTEAAKDDDLAKATLRYYSLYQLSERFTREYSYTSVPTKILFIFGEVSNNSSNKDLAEVIDASSFTEYYNSVAADAEINTLAVYFIDTQYMQMSYFDKQSKLSYDGTVSNRALLTNLINLLSQLSDHNEKTYTTNQDNLSDSYGAKTYSMFSNGLNSHAIGVSSVDDGLQSVGATITKYMLHSTNGANFADDLNEFMTNQIKATNAALSAMYKNAYRLASLAAYLEVNPDSLAVYNKSNVVAGSSYYASVDDSSALGFTVNGLVDCTDWTSYSMYDVTFYDSSTGFKVKNVFLPSINNTDASLATFNGKYYDIVIS